MRLTFWSWSIHYTAGLSLVILIAVVLQLQWLDVSCHFQQTTVINHGPYDRLVAQMWPAGQTCAPLSFVAPTFIPSRLLHKHSSLLVLYILKVTGIIFKNMVQFVLFFFLSLPLLYHSPPFPLSLHTLSNFCDITVTLQVF